MFSWTHLIAGRFGCVTLLSVLPPSLTTLPHLAPSPPVRRDPHTPTLPAPGLPTCRTSAWRTHLPRDGPWPPGARRALLGGHLLHNPYRCLELPDVPAAPCTRIETSESRTLSWEISKTPAPKTLKKRRNAVDVSRMDKLMNQLAKYPKRLLCRIRKIITRLDVSNTRTLDENSQVPPWTHWGRPNGWRGLGMWWGGETPKVNSNLGLNKPSRWFWYSLKFENHWSRIALS